MNSIVRTAIAGYQPEQFISRNVTVIDLIVQFKLSPAEAEIVSILLREYKASIPMFRMRAARNHITNIRKKLRSLLGCNPIVSVGMGYYLMPDAVKITLTWH